MITILFYFIEIAFSFFVVIHIMCLFNLNLFYYFPFLYDLSLVIFLIPLFFVIVYIALAKSISEGDKNLFYNCNLLKKNKKESPIFRIGSIFLLVYWIFNFLSNKDRTIGSFINMASLPAYRLVSGFLIYFYFMILRVLLILKKHREEVSENQKSSSEPEDLLFMASSENKKHISRNKRYFQAGTFKLLERMSIFLFYIILFLIIEHLFKLKIEDTFPVIYIFIIILGIPLVLTDSGKEIRFYKTKEEIHFYKKRNVLPWMSVLHSIIILFLIITFALSFFFPIFNIISIKSAFLILSFYLLARFSKQVGS